MKVKKLLNTSEVITYTQIEKDLFESGYRIFPSLPLKDVIDNGIKKSLDRKGRLHFDSSHFDFVIYDNAFSPVFAIEFDGPSHFEFEKKRKADIRKNKICQLASFPLIRITDLEIDYVDSISILQYIIYHFIKWKEEIGRIQAEIQEYILEMSEVEFTSKTEEGFLDPSIDPSFWFDIEFVFPLTVKIKKDIKEKYNLRSDVQNSKDKSAVWFAVFPGNEGSDQDGIFKASYSYGIYKGITSNDKYTWEGGKICSDEIQVLIEGQEEFGLKFALVTEEDYDRKDSPANYFFKNGKLPIFFGQPNGVSIPSICESICEYLCYKNVLKWLEKNYN